MEGGIEDIEGAVGERVADGGGREGVGGGAEVDGGPDGGFGGTVFIEEGGLGEKGVVQLHEGARAGFTPNCYTAQGSKLRRSGVLQYLAVERRHKEQVRDLDLF